MLTLACWCSRTWGMYSETTQLLYDHFPYVLFQILEMAVNEGGQMKKPRLVHYCDGVVEEFSSDEEDQVSLGTRNFLSQRIVS